MKIAPYTLLLSFILFAECSFYSQTQTVRENSKWGIKENNAFIIPAVYDTIFGFDSTNSVCLACFRITKASSSKFIKTTTTSYACNYLNKKAQRLITQNEAGDTSSVFLLQKSTVNNYLLNQDLFTVNSKGQKNLVQKNFKQFTFKGYSDITQSEDPNLFYTQIMNDAEVTVSGIINSMERELIPYQYSIVKVNTHDSLIIACSAGIYSNAEDLVYDFDGRKKEASHRHIDQATKHFLIHKIFEPKEYYIFFNLETKEEIHFTADELKLYQHDEILVRIKKDWYLYNLQTNTKTPFKPS